MTQPPYGNEPQPPYGNEPQPPYGSTPQYPHQDLLPQQVQPGRSRMPLILAAVAVVVALVAGLVVWRVVLYDSGEGTRAAYCAQLKKITGTDGLGGLLDGAGNGGQVVPKAVTDLADLAPGSVKSQWTDLIDLVQNATGDTPDLGQIARAFTDLQTIIADANSQCGLDLQIPG